MKSFVYVAETGSFSLAAARCYVTQSAVSQHVRALEEELGCRLLIRTARGVTLTEYGEALLPMAKEMLKHSEDCVEHIHALNNCMTGELRLGVGSFIAPYIRRAALTFMERYPGVRLNAEFGKACRLNQMLRSHDIDLAFTMNTAVNGEGIVTQEAIPFSITAVMSDTHPLASVGRLKYEDLLKHGVVMPDVGERVFDTFQKYLKQDLTKLNVRCIVSNPDEALAVVEAGRLITFLPKMYLKNHPTLAARPIEGLEMELMSNVHWMQDVPLKRSAKLFIDIVREEAVPYLKTTMG